MAKMHGGPFIPIFNGCYLRFCQTLSPRSSQYTLDDTTVVIQLKEGS